MNLNISKQIYEHKILIEYCPEDWRHKIRLLFLSEWSAYIMYIWHILSKLQYILSHQDSVGRAPTSRWSFRTKKTCPFSSYFFSQILWLRLWTPFPYLCKRDLGNGHPLIVLSLSSPQATCASMKWTNLKKKIIASSVCQGPPRSIWV